MVAHALAQLSFSGPQVERRMCPVPHAYIPQLHTHTHKHTGTAVLLRSSCKKTHVLCAARITFTCTHTHTHTLTHTHTGAAVLHVKRRMCPVPHAYISQLHTHTLTHTHTNTLAQLSFSGPHVERHVLCAARITFTCTHTHIHTHTHSHTHWCSCPPCKETHVSCATRIYFSLEHTNTGAAVLL